MRALPPILAAVLVIFNLHCSGQSDTIIVYTPSTQQMDTILPVAFDTTVQSSHTGSYIGNLFGQTELSTELPVNDLWPGVNHMELQLASDWFDVANYPMRAAVKLARWDADTLQPGCSGMMVSRSFVLTASHCVLGYSSGEFVEDGLVAFLGFDHGEEHYTIPSSPVKRFYVFKRNLEGQTQFGYDIALLELEYPIGEQSGWVGIGFGTDEFINSNVFHKFSYPTRPHTNPNLDTTHNYNGDTMYYNYGEIEADFQSLVVPSPNAFGLAGQSGSSFFYTNNFKAYSIGVMTFSNFYRHTRISNSIYYQFKNILDQDLQVSVEESRSSELNVFPNPTTGNVTVNLSEFYGQIHLIVRNSLGQVVHTAQLNNSQQIDLTIPGEAGVYILELTTDTGKEVLRVVKE